MGKSDSAFKPQLGPKTAETLRPFQCLNDAKIDRFRPLREIKNGRAPRIITKWKRSKTTYPVWKFCQINAERMLEAERLMLNAKGSTKVCTLSQKGVI